MKKSLVLVLGNMGIMLLFYICGMISAASFDIFKWDETIRSMVSVFYGTISLLFNAIIIIEYNPHK